MDILYMHDQREFVTFSQMSCSAFFMHHLLNLLCKILTVDLVLRSISLKLRYSLVDISLGPESIQFWKSQHLAHHEFEPQFHQGCVIGLLLNFSHLKCHAAFNVFFYDLHRVRFHTFSRSVHFQGQDTGCRKHTIIFQEVLKDETSLIC